MTVHVLKAWQVDIDARTNGLNKHNPTGYTVNAHEIAPGVVYRDGNVTVTAFPAHTRKWLIRSATDLKRRTAPS